MAIFERKNTPEYAITQQINFKLGYINQIYIEIGRYVKLNLADKIDNPDIQRMLSDIDRTLAELNGLNKQLDTVRGVKRCVQCNGEIPINVAFCPLCGTKQPVQQPVQPQYGMPVQQVPPQQYVQPVIQNTVQPAVQPVQVPAGAAEPVIQPVPVPTDSVQPVPVPVDSVQPVENVQPIPVPFESAAAETPAAVIPEEAAPAAESEGKYVFCTQCGSKEAVGVKFCSECGSIL